jgi:hypothetical protein
MQHGLGEPCAAQMLTVWLIRHFTHALGEHVGQGALDPAIKRHLGIGNATGLGMAPFLVTHPVLLNNWIIARETALARVRAVAALIPAQIARLGKLAQRVAAHLEEWNLADPVHQARIAALRAEWGVVSTALQPLFPAQSQPVEAVMQHVSGTGEDMQELMAALFIEPFGDLVDGWLIPTALLRRRCATLMRWAWIMPRPTTAASSGMSPPPRWSRLWACVYRGKCPAGDTFGHRAPCRGGLC